MWLEYSRYKDDNTEIGSKHVVDTNRNIFNIRQFMYIYMSR
jgi:hypothetical protein